MVCALEPELGGSATAGIRAVGLHLQIAAALKNIFKNKNLFNKRVYKSHWTH
jgi:hypothetical protein